MATQEDHHYGLGDPAILDKIDRLFACGVGDYINLPQIVVVGDQSSGKSSVLEGLIRKPLPRDSGLCTRFTTQIIFKRSSCETISVSIIPGTDATDEHKAGLHAWSKRELQTLDCATFASIMEEVHHTMGLSRHQEGSARKGPTFSRDVLRLEICGPTQEHLSVIDVPGIFKNTTPGITTKEDISLVRSMVLGYMENPRSVMLAVIPANVDVATQEILQLAADVDPDGKRTLGVLTKPDLVDQGAESRVVDLLQGQAHPLRLGWHVVRNPGQQHLSDMSLDRGRLEQDFFNTRVPWNKLETYKVGIESLRLRIQYVLSDLVRQEFPKVKQETARKLTLARGKLSQLGMERETPEKQLLYLTDLATKFQRVVSFSVDAKYGSDAIFDDMQLRLATLISTRNVTFSDDLSRHGQEYCFTTSENLRDTDGDSPPPLSWESVDSDSSEREETFETRKLTDSVDVEEILQAQESFSTMNGKSIARWLREVYTSSRGFELGTFDSSILATTMKVQSTKWTGIALGYISDVVAIVHRFIDRVLDSICHERLVKSELLSVLMDGLLERYSKAIDHVRFLLDVERVGTPMTLNHYFTDNLEKCRQKRMKTLMSRMSINDCTHGQVVPLQDVAQSHPMSNTEHVVQDLHDILFSYYKVARKRFVDSVCMQAADHFLINGPQTPLALFSPMFVSSLNAEQLEAIAGEDYGSRRTRLHLKREIASLEDAKKILK
ncbi:uncharacterized protein Z518_05704 [Rhinocladiella mackenziei CBS 650.93]|uniref:Dynamin GTPase n=1 Tax=Rhinocladiella mackenziei CBS 650.93 TaxID=1442369 RepID=A0A0D2H325_9EURO|nr:uncharacterized protein Z518_05704 [Rhinocladiella mackenziei CBS 650.93]KIX04833.1 hypothetical protein Z518_05704 [Rhinocladiella mackenziei CBS 650.93]